MTNLRQLEKIREIVNVYFYPWGATKAAMWEDLVGNKPFSPEVALKEIQKVLENDK